MSPRNVPDGPEYRFDFPPLILEHKAYSKRTATLVDLDVDVYGLDEIKKSSLPISAIILSHGRCHSAKIMTTMASGLLGEIDRLHRENGGEKIRDVIVVALDHRNHGARTRFRNTNLSFDKNPMHLVDMAATTYAGAQDQGFIMEFLAPYLFPRGERVIDTFVPVGVSMGGNSVWRMLRHDPRVTMAVPIISIPSECLGANLEERASQYGFTPEQTIYPDGVRRWFMEQPPKGTYEGKKILVINGGKDWTMPIERATPVIAKISEEADVEWRIDEAVGHKISPLMVRWAADAVWRWTASKQNAGIPASKAKAKL